MFLVAKRRKSHACSSISLLKSHACCSMSQQKKFLMSMVLATTLVQLVHSEGLEGDESSATYYWDFRMPGVSTTKSDEYLCTAMALNSSKEEWLLAFEPEATIEKVHHMTLYGCADVPQTSGVWDCAHFGVCHRSRHITLWASNAPATVLPSGVGFRVGGDSDVQFLALQVHYSTAMPDIKDRSGYKIQVTTKRQTFAAGFLLVTRNTATIPPNSARTHLDASCQLKSIKVLDDIHIIGYRVHTHKLGTVVKGYRYDVKTREYQLILAGNPQWPQAIYPREEVMTLTPEDVVAVRCTYNTTGVETATYIGRSSANEMCIADMLYYTENLQASEVMCDGIHDRDVIKNLPEGNDEPLLPNPVLAAEAHAANIDKSEVITYRPVEAQAPASRRVQEAPLEAWSAAKSDER